MKISLIMIKSIGCIYFMGFSVLYVGMNYGPNVSIEGRINKGF
jgi:hypothetical protein